MDFQCICNNVIQISKEVGAFLLREQNDFKKEKIETKGLNDFVSYVDKAAEQKVGHALLELLPEAGFIGEEGEFTLGRKEICWVVDPLDGTTNFIHLLPMYCTSVALMIDEEVVLGVIYNPVLDECFSAFKGGGPYLNGKTISVSNTLLMENSLIATGFPYTNFDRADEYVNAFDVFMHKSRGLRRYGSAAIDLAYIACGRFDGFWECGLNAWDVAAGSIIVEEAGGKVTDFSGTGNFVFGGEIVAANPAVCQQMNTVVQEHFS